MRTISEWIQYFDSDPEAATNEMSALGRKEYYQLLCASGSEHIPYAYTQLHVHTDLGSPKDSILKVTDYVDINKKLHTRSGAVTDHGTMYGITTAYKEFSANDMKLIIGLEAYLCDDVESTELKRHTRLHLILYAKDNIGYQGLSDLVTASNYRIITTKGGSFPCISKSMLESLLAPGKKYHDHIIATSACVGGVLAGIGFANKENKENVSLLARRKEELDQLYHQFSDLIAICAENRALCKKAETICSSENRKRLSEIQKNMIKYPQDYDEADRKRIDLEQTEYDESNRTLPSLKKMTRENTRLKNQIQVKIQELTNRIYDNDNQLTSAVPRIINDLESEIQAIQDKIISEEQLNDYLKREMLYYRDLFGPECWFVELQNHGIEAEKKFMPLLAQIAIENKIPVVAANDAHMSTREMLFARKAINSLRFNTWEAPQVGDSELYLKTDGELFKSLCMILPKPIAGAAMCNRKAIVDSCSVTFSKVPHYPKYIP